MATQRPALMDMVVAKLAVAVARDPTSWNMIIPPLPLVPQQVVLWCFLPRPAQQDKGPHLN